MISSHRITYAAGHTVAKYKMLIHMGFSHTQAQYLLQTRNAAALERHKRDFTRAKFKALTTSGQTMKSLLAAKFTRPQAKVLIAQGLVS